MSRLDALVADLCPKGVRFGELGAVAKYSTTRVDASRLTSESFVGVDNLLPNRGGRIDATYRPNTDRLTEYKVGDVLLGNIRPYLKKVWQASNTGGSSGDVLVIRASTADIEPRFLYYLLSTDDFFAYDMRHATGGKMPRGSRSAVMRYRIPVPPIEVQREIVRALDKFTELEAALEAELKARRRQFEFYTDSLLTLEGVPRVPLGELGTFLRGRRFTKADYDPDGIGCIHYGEIYTTFGTWTRSVVSRVRAELAPALRYAQPGDVVLVDVGESVEDVGKATAWLGDEPVAIHDHCYAFRHPINPKFVSYYMQTSSFRSQKLKFIARTKVNTLLIDGFAKIPIPNPSLEEQARIVSVLDKFDALINDLTVGLPAELAARRKQYEYYRDRLLTFDEAV